MLYGNCAWLAYVYFEDEPGRRSAATKGKKPSAPEFLLSKRWREANAPQPYVENSTFHRRKKVAAREHICLVGDRAFRSCIAPASVGPTAQTCWGARIGDEGKAVGWLLRRRLCLYETTVVYDHPPPSSYALWRAIAAAESMQAIRKPMAM